ncbi:hypothetical protein FDP51_14670 [Enterococcus mundtii]|uniref:hypothetical protein n=1 Tax=Enterococcus mundtii TaxID=53346 RepID=UPI00129C7212|nr:hypothetical protein [Enterococcus mundtii]MRI75191.1 hypothetical protein [Enterococcus mundtii]
MQNVLNFVNCFSLDGLLATSASILALLIPLAILLIENNGNAKDQSFSWDKMVIFSQVIEVKKTVLGLIFITIPLIFWEVNILRPVILFIYIVGIFFMSKLLKDSYDWITSKYKENEYFRNEKRFKYLDDLKDDQIIYDTWKLIWETEEQRIGLDETKLTKKFFVTYKNLENKEKFASLFISNFVVDRENHDIIQDFFYDELKRIIEDMKKEDFKEVTLFYALQVSYLDYMKQCYEDMLLMNKYNNSFDKFFSETDEQSLEKFFSNNLDVRMVEIIRNSPLIPSQFVIQEEFLPKNFQYETVEDNKKKVISTIFSRWISNLYKTNDSSYFASNLFEVMFEKADPTIFFRLTEFVLYFSSNIDSYIGLMNDTKKTLIDYSNTKIILNTIGRNHGSWIEGDLKALDRIMEANSQEREWSYKYILSIENRAFLIIQNKKFLEKFIFNIDELLNSNDPAWDIPKSSTRLETLKNDFIKLKELLNKN